MMVVVFLPSVFLSFFFFSFNSITVFFWLVAISLMIFSFFRFFRYQQVHKQQLHNFFGPASMCWNTLLYFLSLLIFLSHSLTNFTYTKRSVFFQQKKSKPKKWKKICRICFTQKKSKLCTVHTHTHIIHSFIH